MARPSRPSVEAMLLVGSLAGLATGGVFALAGEADVAHALWAGTTAIAVLPAVGWVWASLRRREPGVDIIAVLALLGTLAVSELLAGAVIAVMLASGRAIEARASSRAERDLRALLSRAPRRAHRHENGQLVDRPVEQVTPADLLLVRPGEVVPVDGLIESDLAVLDESALTGEPLPAERRAGDAVRSGVVNAGAPFDLRATTSAAQSTYAGIVRLVEQAQAGSAPFVRLADRYAAGFLPLALGIAGLAWLLSGDPVRAVAVLVVATPCPLLLAAPVAIVSGLARAARRGVIVKGGAALERLARGEVLLFDKTGTITLGRPTVIDVVAVGGRGGDEVLRLAASLDQVTPHVLAAAVVREARQRGLSLVLPSDVEEVHGYGVRGRVEGRAVAVGKAAWVAGSTAQPWVRALRRRAALDGSLTVFVQIDGAPAGALLLEDPIRPDAARTIRHLRSVGLRRMVMVTGDHVDVAETVGAAIGVDDVLAERTPADKVEAVQAESRTRFTVMVGDGVNDAPALASAGVGVAVGARGSTASSEAADVVLTVDRLDRLADAIGIARRARRIALQSVIVGMGLSLAAMLLAAVGLLPPTAGALLQESIDVAVILNALRALGGGHQRLPRLEGAAADLTERFSADHRRLRAPVEQLRTVADALASLPGEEALRRLRAVHRFLVEDLLPHEEAEDRQLYPAVARVLGGADPTATMSRMHVEIAHLVRRLGRLLDDLPESGPDEADVAELRPVLYGLHAILRLHNAQEEEGYFTLADEPTRDAPAPAALGER